MLGTARIVFRVWQVYWAHIGIFLVTAIMLFAIDFYDLGDKDTPYIEGPWVVPLFEQTGEALIGLFTLTYVPGLFDILPMYLVILAMIPLLMALARIGGPRLAMGAVLAVWLAANLAGYARKFGDADDLAMWQQAVVALGRPMEWMNFPSNPFGDGTWFFNPLGWQLVFFTGFAFGMGWLKAPPVRSWLVALAAAFVVLTIPLAWYKLHGEYSLVADTVLHDAIIAIRDFIEPLRWKTWQGGLRFLHFLAIAYLAWAAVGPGGVRLSQGFSAVAPARWLFAGALAVLAATFPVAYPKEIALLFPGYDAGLEAVLSFNQIGMLQLLHLVALLVVVWQAIGAAGRAWAARDAFLATVPVIRKVGTQSLAVFMVSIPLSRAMGWWMDVLGRDVWTRGAINLTGFAILIGVAYFCAWMKRQPWREPPKRAADGGSGGVPATVGRPPGVVVPAGPA